MMDGIVCAPWAGDGLIDAGRTDGWIELRIHDEIERGDNESIKMPGSTLGGAGPGKCCSS